MPLSRAVQASSSSTPPPLARNVLYETTSCVPWDQVDRGALEPALGRHLGGLPPGAGGGG